MRHQNFRRPLAACPHNNAVRVQKIHHRGAFTQELGIGDDIELLRRNSMAVKYTAYPVVGVNRNRALLHKHFVALDGARNFTLQPQHKRGPRRHYLPAEYLLR